MVRNEFYDGILYQIEYQPNLSNGDYTAHHVYHVKTEEQNFPLAYTVIEGMMNDGSWRKGYWKFKNEIEPSMANALHSYHTFDYDKDTGVYVYTHVIPYDD